MAKVCLIIVVWTLDTVKTRWRRLSRRSLGLTGPVGRRPPCGRRRRHRERGPPGSWGGVLGLRATALRTFRSASAASASRVVGGRVGVAGDRPAHVLVGVGGERLQGRGGACWGCWRPRSRAARPSGESSHSRMARFTSATPQPASNSSTGCSPSTPLPSSRARCRRPG